MKKHQGFTLIELLVVIAIIAVLMGIILPSLNRVRELAKGSNCLSNQKSLMLAYTMYVGDFDGKIVQGYVTRMDMSMPMWVKPPITTAGTYISGVPLLEDRIRGIKQGSLYKYINNHKMFHCPGDNRYQSATEMHMAIYRSYIIPDVLAGTSDFPEYSNGFYNNRHRTIVKKMSQIKQPGTKYTFCESEFKNSNFNYDHGGWTFAPWKERFWRDQLATFHSKSATFAFADGHAEKHKWVHKETWEHFQGMPSQALNPPFAVNEDMRWCWEHYPYVDPGNEPKY